ncbi:MAG: hypothetical protein AAB066_00525 [Candidatus Margulisiibacteriota bacterium]
MRKGTGLAVWALLSSVTVAYSPAADPNSATNFINEYQQLQQMYMLQQGQGAQNLMPGSSGPGGQFDLSNPAFPAPFAPNAGATQPGKLNIPAYLMREYMGKEVPVFQSSSSERFSKQKVTGVVKEKDQYFLMLNNGDKAKVMFEFSGTGTPSSRTNGINQPNALQYQLYMQQMLSQSLGPILGGSDDSGEGSSEFLMGSGLQTAMQPPALQQTPALSDTQKQIVAYFDDSEIYYVKPDAKGGVSRGVPDYLSSLQAIVLRDGTLLKERFVRYNGH